MKISKVRPLVMGTPWRNLTFVVVETDNGLTGVGEARMINNTDALLGYLAEAAPRYVIGRIRSTGNRSSTACAASITAARAKSR